MGTKAASDGRRPALVASRYESALARPRRRKLPYDFVNLSCRATFWLAWMISAFVTTCYAVISIVVFCQLIRVHNVNGFPSSNRRQIRGPTAAALYGGVMVILTNFIAFCILLRKTTARSGAGFSYGYMSASYAITAWVLLLVGIVMWAGRDSSFWSQTVKWNGKWGSLYTATYVLAWICCGIYLITWLIFMLFMQTVQKEKVDEEAAHLAPTAAGGPSSYPAAGSAPTTQMTGRKTWFGRHKMPDAAPATAGPLGSGNPAAAAGEPVGSAAASGGTGHAGWFGGQQQADKLTQF